MKKLFNCTLISTMILIIPMATASDASGQAIGFTCAGCHGYDGASQGVVDSLKGEDENELRSELMEFKSGEKKGTIMNRIIRGYSDEEIAAVARYFSGLK